MFLFFVNILGNPACAAMSSTVIINSFLPAYSHIVIREKNHKAIFSDTVNYI